MEKLSPLQPKESELSEQEKEIYLVRSLGDKRQSISQQIQVLKGALVLAEDTKETRARREQLSALLNNLAVIGRIVSKLRKRISSSHK